MCFEQGKRELDINGGWKIKRTGLRALEMYESGDNLCVDPRSSKPVSYPKSSYTGLSPWAGVG